MPKLLLLFLLLFLNLPGYAQAGCTDPQALNYNASASSNDGSCTYAYTAITPQHMCWLDAAMMEISGHVCIGNSALAINDGSNMNTLYFVDTTNGAVLDSLPLNPISNVDWEDVTATDSFIYIGDFGNNIGTRQDLKIYKLPKQDVLNKNLPLSAQVLAFAYEDQISFNSNASTNYDCEAFIAFDDSIYLFTKNWGNQKTYVYAMLNDTGYHQAALVDSFTVNGLITSAAIHNGKLALLGYESNGNSFVWLMWDYQQRHFFSGNKRRVDFGIAGGQAEGVDFLSDERLMISNEKYSIFNQRFASLDIAPLFNNATALSNNRLTAELSVFQDNKHLLIQSKKAIQALEIISMNGEKKLYDKINKTMKKVDLLNFVPGKYIIRLFYDDKVTVSKLIHVL